MYEEVDGQLYESFSHWGMFPVDRPMKPIQFPEPTKMNVKTVVGRYRNAARLSDLDVEIWGVKL